MASIKKEKNNTYSIQFRYKNYAGVNCRKHKYNFKTIRSILKIRVPT